MHTPRTVAALPRIAAALGAAALLLPCPSAAQDFSSCSLMGSSYADTLLNPPKSEDTDFFVSSGGVPNVMFLVDTSGSMLRLPPDGAAQGWGSFENPASVTAGGGYGCTNGVGNTRTFASSCGLTTVEGLPFTNLTDWGAAKDLTNQYCPYLDQAGQPLKTDKPGYDPDWYATFFPKDNVYVEALYFPSDGKDGWTSGTSTSSGATATFCSGRATPALRTSCQTCMDTQGYWFDGTYRTFGGSAPAAAACGTTADCVLVNGGTCIGDSGTPDAGRERTSGVNDGKAHCKIPLVYFRGNFLNFYPPKFVMARKAMKDILASVRLFRLGIATFDSSGSGAGATLMDSLNPPCNLVNSTSAFYNNRNSVKANINNTGKLSFAGTTPLAEALLDVSHYYATGSLPWFAGTTYDRVAFEEKTTNNRSVCYSCQKSSVIVLSDGIPTQDSSIPGKSGWSPITKALADTPGVYAGSAYNITTLSAADCPECEQPAELADLSLPGGSLQCYGQQTSGACDDAFKPITAWFPRVAWYVNNMDHRLDTEAGVDGYKMEGKQELDVYVIGLGTSGAAAEILAHGAQVGGGKYYPAANGAEMRTAIDSALEEVNTRSIAFGTAALSTLQASSSQGVLIPRFSPSKEAHWNGHLYSFDLWSEFTGGCTVPASGASGPANGDYDCDGKCTSVFLRDRNLADPSKPGDFISEDATGTFVKNAPRDRAACGYGNLCADCAGQSSIAAVPYWDAGNKLSPLEPDGDDKTTKDYQDWNERKIYTVIDDALPLGRLTSADSLLRLADDDATVTKLTPYLNVAGDKAFCGDLADRLDGAGDLAEATKIRTEVMTKGATFYACTRSVVRYAMGADLFNARGCASYPTSYCTRPFQLGDVFHSSPTEVWPPLGSDGLLCSRGLHPQCLSSLFSGSIPNPSSSGNANAYDDYAKSAAYRRRNKFALFGANDGMLHAILTGVWHAGQDDPKTAAREDQPPYDGYHDRGTGEELWAFVPPDQLAKLRLLMGITHHYFVDGTAMVRDVWIDGGTPNRLGGATSMNGIREGNEFHTVAVVGERRGGTKYFALDVTDAGNDLDAKPRFLWIYPQPNDREHLEFGQTYAEFVPSPPPIGPVRVDAGAPPCANPNHREVTTSSGASRCFEERWIVALSGGFDQQYTRGRGVHMVEIGTGAELFDFSQPKGAASACDATKDPRCHLNYPVAAPVGLMMWGTEATFTDRQAREGYFDTATFGDTGGQLWVLRFNDPALLDASGKATNWFGARAFQMNKPGALTHGVDYCGSQPFFHITANLPLKASNYYRVLAGTGDRFNLLDHAGGICSPDNLRACVNKGCSYKVDKAANFGIEKAMGTNSYTMSLNASCGTFDPILYTNVMGGGGGTTCEQINSKIDKITISCPSTVTCSGVAETTTKQASVGYDKAGMYAKAGGTLNYGNWLDLKGVSDKRNWFFSVQVFETAGSRRIFNSLATAISYDTARLSEADLTDVNAHDANPLANPLAAADGRGWRYFFDHGTPTLPNTLTFDGLTHQIWRADERVVSTAAVEASCTFWNTIQVAIPMDAITGNVCPVASPCKAGKRQVSYLYGANPGTGEQCLFVSGALARSHRTNTVVPPHIGKLTAYVSGGQVAFGLTSIRIPSGGTNISLGEAQDISSLVEWLPVDRDTHECRHGEAPYSTGRGTISCQ